MSEPSIPSLYTGLVDDAALFPPGNAPMPDALASHAEHRASWYRALVGPFLCPDTRLPELRKELPASLGGRTTGSSGEPADGSAEPTEPLLELGLIITGGAGAIEPAITWVRREPVLRLRGLEIALRDEPDPGRNVDRIALALRSAGIEDLDSIPISVEIPPGQPSPNDGDAPDVLDALAQHGYRAKLRTGAPDGSAPSPERVARFILNCLDRELAFKCTAGLHHAVRNEQDEQHGFLNILAATHAALGGADESDVIRALAETDPLVLQADLGGLNEDAARSVRRWFGSFGSCSIVEPLDDLTELELIRTPS